MEFREIQIHLHTVSFFQYSECNVSFNSAEHPSQNRVIKETKQAVCKVTGVPTPQYGSETRMYLHKRRLNGLNSIESVEMSLSRSIRCCSVLDNIRSNNIQRR